MGLKAWDPFRASFCDECPQKRAADKFRDEVEEVLQQRLGRKAKKYSFSHLLRTVRRASGMEDTPLDELSVKSYWLLNTYLDEKRKYDRYKDANRPKAAA